MRQVIYENPDDPLLQRGLRKVRRFKEVKGDLKNEIAFGVLYEHFIQGVDKKTLVEGYLEPGQNPTQINKLLADTDGKEAARRHDVRRVFFEFAVEAGLIEKKDGIWTPIKKEQSDGQSATGRID